MQTMGNEHPVYLACDIDMTLLAGDWCREDRPFANGALQALTAAVKKKRTMQNHFYFGTASGRTLASHHMEVEMKNPVFRRAVEEMNLLIGSVGAEMAMRSDDDMVTPVAEWTDSFDRWDRQKVQRILSELEQSGEVTMQPPMAQSDNKLSYFVTIPEGRHASYAEHIRKILSDNDVVSTVIFSGGKYLDILPRTLSGTAVDKGAAIQFGATLLAEQDNLAEEPRVVFAGDSENDESGFAYAIESGGVAIIPGNAKESFKAKMKHVYLSTRLHIARRAFSAGIQEGLAVHDLL